MRLVGAGMRRSGARRRQGWAPRARTPPAPVAFRHRRHRASARRLSLPQWLAAASDGRL